MPDRPLTVSVNLFFILLNALLWFVFGGIILTNAHPALPDLPYIKTAMAMMSLLIAILLAFMFFYLRKHNRTAYYFSLMFFVFVSILTIFDDFGYSDLLVLVINLIPIVLLIKDRGWYLQIKHTSVGVSSN